VKTLHTYLTRQVLVSLLMTVAVFTFVLLLGNVLREVLSALVNRQATFTNVAKAIGLLIPFVWVFALPMGMLTATLLIFGRFSADQELTAIRASGVSLVSIISPILLLSLALCALSALVNMDIAPRCRVKYRTLMDGVAYIDFANAIIPEGRFIKDFPGYIFLVGKNRRGAADNQRVLEDVMLFHSKGQTNEEMFLHAPRGTLENDSQNHRIVLKLFDARSLTMDNGVMMPGWNAELPVEVDLRPPTQAPDRPKISDMTFRQLRAEYQEWQRRLDHSALSELPASASLQERKEELKVRKEELKKLRQEWLSPVRVQMHQQVAFSFACFGFTLVGIPLGIRVHRRETNVGIAMALLLAAGYYSFIMVAQALDRRPEFAPHLIVWLPNFVFQATGSVLLWRANRGF
jgi:lipopolysaccharide export system permease protein